MLRDTQRIIAKLQELEDKYTIETLSRRRTCTLKEAYKSDEFAYDSNSDNDDAIDNDDDNAIDNNTAIGNTDSINNNTEMPDHPPKQPYNSAKPTSTDLVSQGADVKAPGDSDSGKNIHYEKQACFVSTTPDLASFNQAITNAPNSQITKDTNINDLIAGFPAIEFYPTAQHRKLTINSLSLDLDNIREILVSNYSLASYARNV